MDTQKHLSLRLTNDDIVRLRTSIGADTHELSLDREEFEQLFRHMLKLRAKLDLRDASRGFDRR
ncbi:MAG: hypothetical protein KTR15_04340 [Phycisphaeraceae bacterium]|nr:hypothetical protein [Phycisphaeraceae bacterium]